MLIEEKAEFGMQITEYLPLHGHRPNMQKRRIFENQNNGFLIFEKLDYGLFLVLHGHPTIPKMRHDNIVMDNLTVQADTILFLFSCVYELN
jgi:hypothetical protein